MVDNGAEPEPLRLAPSPPARRILLPLSAIDAEQYGVGELLDIAEVLGTDLAGLSALMSSPGIHQARLVVAIAWMLARRLEPDVTFADAQRWRIEVDTQSDPTTGGAETPPELIAERSGL